MGDEEGGANAPLAPPLWGEDPWGWRVSHPSSEMNTTANQGEYSLILPSFIEQEQALYWACRRALVGEYLFFGGQLNP